MSLATRNPIWWFEALPMRELLSWCETMMAELTAMEEELNGEHTRA